MGYLMKLSSLRFARDKLTMTAVLVAILLGTLPANAQITGQKIPDNVNLPVVGGKTSRTIGEVLKGHDLTVLQFWASWCVGCGDVMAQMAKRAKSDASVGYASISIDEDMPTAVRYFKSKPAEVQAALPNALLDIGGDKVASPLNIKSLPLVLIVAEDGKVVQMIAGHPKPDVLTAMIAKIRQDKGARKATK